MCPVTGSSTSRDLCVGVGLWDVFVLCPLSLHTPNQHVSRLIIHGATAKRGVT